MCLYHTFHWSCCPGTAAPAPYYMHTECELAQTPRKRGMRTKKCQIEHVVLDGADYDEPCPKCGQKASDREDPTDEVQIDSAAMEPASCCD